MPSGCSGGRIATMRLRASRRPSRMSYGSPARLPPASRAWCGCRPRPRCLRRRVDKRPHHDRLDPVRGADRAGHALRPDGGFHRVAVARDASRVAIELRDSSVIDHRTDGSGWTAREGSQPPRTSRAPDGRPGASALRALVVNLVPRWPPAAVLRAALRRLGRGRCRRGWRRIRGARAWALTGAVPRRRPLRAAPCAG
jgi:hypothetical protein